MSRNMYVLTFTFKLFNKGSLMKGTYTSQNVDIVDTNWQRAMHKADFLKEMFVFDGVQIMMTEEMGESQ